MANQVRPAASAPRPFDPTIFREYDIRGIVGKTLHVEDAYLIGRAFASFVSSDKNPSICIGRDGRISSPEFMQAVCRGISDAGVDVIDIGLGPTPMLYFAATTLKTSAGLMITGSHNPKDHNGFKFMLHGKAFYGQQIQELRQRAESGNLPAGHGTHAAKDVREDYLSTLLNAYDGTRALNVAWDAGNGACGEIMSLLCRRLPGKNFPMNAEIDGAFPAHHPDPTVPENLEELQRAIKSHKLDAGIAFDGDGDRIGVVDDEGVILWGDQLLMLYSKDVLEAFPGATIIADVKASGALFEEIKRLGGKGLMWKTGHSLIKSKLVETGGKLAGEMSGHIFFADKYFGYDDALYAAIRLMGLLSRSGKKLSDLRKALPQRINTPEIRFVCDEARKFAVIAEVQDRLKKTNADFNDIDGVRVNTKDGWWLLRASNTQPMLVARCEGLNMAGLERLKEDLRNQLALSNVALP